MILHSVPLNTDPLLSNVQLLDFNNELNEQEISRQIQNGLYPDDLEQLGGVIPAQSPISIAGSANITTPLQQSLESQIGQQKLCLLYTGQAPMTIPGWSNLECQQVVAVRVMKVVPETEESATIVVQPTVMTTKTAALARFIQAQADGVPGRTTATGLYQPNPYVYKLFVSR